VEFEVLKAVVMKSIIFWDMTPCSPSSFNRRFGGTYRLHMVLASLITSTLKMEAIVFSETSVETRRTTRCRISEDDTLHNLMYYSAICLVDLSNTTEAG
jgi:hypothetical protein